ncbi:MAG TPA: membrane protein insertase YidC [Phenylobacterium sp.]|nr:membrane protein insertase YidC [Phenylobacterium sp.]
MPNENSRNTIVFVVCAVLILILYQIFVLEPAAKRRQAELKQSAPAASQQAQQRGAPPIAVQPQKVTRQQAAAASPRVPIDTPAVSGSISLRGARIDDLYLKQYRRTVSKTSPPVELLTPEGAEHAWFADFGWTGANLPGMPTPQTVWTLSNGSTLAPGKPVTLTYANGQGLTFTRQISVDDKFMFTVADTVANTGAAPVTLAPYASIQRQGIPSGLGTNQIVHEGAVGWLNERLRLFKYKKWAKEGGEKLASTGGWAGITDKYWLTAIIPPQAERIEGQFRVTPSNGVDIFEANYLGAPRAIAPGRQVTETSHFFAGAKVAPMLKDYQEALKVPNLDQAVDWGNFWFLTRPIFIALEFFYGYVGNFGIAILLLTVCVKLVFFPLQNKSYESITKMKKVQPQVEEIRAKYKDDPAKTQQEMMALYGREKINPLMGCIPILIQIPVFYALYKVLTVTIEMRHAPFFGWIDDLSARDPTLVWNLFGLIPWDVATTPVVGGLLAGALGIGAWVLLYGFTMWLTTAMNPPAPDPMQQRIFQLMPIMFTFIMAPFAAGLIIYWTWNNVLSIVQQYIIMHRYKVENPIDNFLARFRGKAVG